MTKFRYQDAPRDGTTLYDEGHSRRALVGGAGALALLGAAGLSLVRSTPRAPRDPNAGTFDDVVVPPFPDLLSRGGWPMKAINFKELRGRVTLVHAFASWCPNCHDEYPYMKQLGSDSRFNLVGVMVMDNKPSAQKFIAEFGNPHSALGFDETGSVRYGLGVSGVPNTFVLDRKGKLIHTVRGGLSPDYFNRVVWPAVEKAITAA